jgi:PBP1b-binding outer membrane lipoprotein LpoB
MRKILVARIVIVALFLVGCTEKQGPAERFGERVDDAVNDARDRLDAASDEAREAADDVRDALEDN